eukprot:1291626-Amphidinium_carterae.2
MRMIYSNGNDNSLPRQLMNGSPGGGDDPDRNEGTPSRSDHFADDPFNAFSNALQQSATELLRPRGRGPPSDIGGRCWRFFWWRRWTEDRQLRIG